MQKKKKKKNPSAWEWGYVMLKCILVIQCQYNLCLFHFYKPHLIYTANLCSQEGKCRVVLHQILDMQLLLLPYPWQFETQVMHWLLSSKKSLCARLGG